MVEKPGGWKAGKFEGQKAWMLGSQKAWRLKTIMGRILQSVWLFSFPASEHPSFPAFMPCLLTMNYELSAISYELVYPTPETNNQ
jgi:hypothetical protein